jgi:hypothetical protein
LGSSADNTSAVAYSHRFHEAKEDMISLQILPNRFVAYNLTFADESTNKAALTGPNAPLLLYRFPEDQASRDDLYNLMLCQDGDCSFVEPEQQSENCADCEADGKLVL